MPVVKLVIELSGYSGHVTESDIIDHLKEIAKGVANYAESESFQDHNRKIQVDYESQEDVSLSITSEIKE